MVRHSSLFISLFFLCFVVLEGFDAPFLFVSEGEQDVVFLHSSTGLHCFLCRSRRTLRQIRGNTNTSPISKAEIYEDEEIYLYLKIFNI